MPANAQARKILGVLIALLIGGVLVAQLLPVGINQVNEPTVVNETIDNGTTETIISGKLNATVVETNASASPQNTTIQLTDLTASESVTHTIDNDTTQTFALSGGDVNVTVTDITAGSPDTVSASYSVPTDFAWSDSSQAIWAIIPLFLVLVPLAVFAGWAMDAF